MQKVNNQPENPENADTNRPLLNGWMELRQGMLVKFDEERRLQYRIFVTLPWIFSVLIAECSSRKWGKTIHTEEYMVYVEDEEGLVTDPVSGQVAKAGAQMAPKKYFYDCGRGRRNYQSLILEVLRGAAESFGNGKNAQADSSK